MARPVVALDIDDVLVDTVDVLFDTYNRLHGTSLGHKDYYSKDINVLGVERYEEAARRLSDIVHSSVLFTSQPNSDAQHAVEELSSYCDLVAITSRPLAIADRTEAWLRTHYGDRISRVVCTSFIMGATDEQRSSTLTKPEVCRQLGASYMVEDHLGHAIPVAEQGVTVFLLDKPWNQADVLPPNVIRVASWADITGRLLQELAGSNEHGNA